MVMALNPKLLIGRLGRGLPAMIPNGLHPSTIICTPSPNIAALIIRIGLGVFFYYSYNKEPRKPYSND